MEGEGEGGSEGDCERDTLSFAFLRVFREVFELVPSIAFVYFLRRVHNLVALLI